jgi:protein involved in polysaccharide export with SLBB domain
MQVTGEVLYPGGYIITNKNERISDVLKQAGGFTAYAYPEGASLKRSGIPASKDTPEEVNKNLEEERLKRLQNLQKAAGDTTNTNTKEAEAVRNTYIGIDLPAILQNPGGKEDIFLEEGDTLTIPKQLQTVKVSGQVLSPNTVIYIQNKGFKQYISNAGGVSDKAIKRRSYILYANGSVKSTHKILFFNNYPIVKPGAEIFVPKKEEKKKLSASEIVGMSTGIATLAAIILNLIKL